MENIIVGNSFYRVVSLYQIVNIVYVLNIYSKMFQIVGNFIGNGFIFDIINLLEVGELSYFYIVQLDFLIQILSI